MSSLLEQASLVITPNAYKAGKLYGLKGTDLDVVRATTATRVNESGLIESVANNVPRLDYTGGGCPSILVEPQRTNTLLYSEDLSNSSWDKFNVTIIANTTIAPDGTLTADTMTNSSTGYGIWQQLMVLPNTQYTFSFYIKKGTNTSYIISVIDAISFADIDTFDYSSQVGTDWVRISKTFTTPSTTTFIRIYPMRDGSSTGTAFLWGAQLEEGSYATSYIPTVASAVTRNADVISKTGIADLIGQSEGTLFYDGFYGNEINEVYLFLQKETSTGVDDSIYIQQSAARIALNVYFGATQQVFIVDGAFTVGQRIKIAAGYKNNDFVLYVNGVQIGTDNSGSVPTCGALQFASFIGAPTTSNFIANKGCKISALWKTRLSNTQLAQLTTI